MPGREPESQNDFMIEKIKTRPINRRKLIRRTIITVVMAVIFGTVACVTFLVLEPVISNQLYPEEEPQPVVFPEDQDEMSPEEMLAENIPSESPSPEPPPDELSTEPPMEEAGVTEERVREILEERQAEVDDVAGIYRALNELLYETLINEDGSSRPGLDQYVVTVRGVISNVDWFDGVQESSNQAPGVIVADNGVELLVLVNYKALEAAESLVLVLRDNYQVPAQLKGLDPDTNLAVIAVERNAVPAEWMEADGLAVAQLGSTGARNLEGTPVIALGSPMGISESVGYGMITSDNTQLTGPDRNYKLLLTDISGSKNAEGFLFNLNGEVIGIITDNKLGSDLPNVIHAYGITEIRRIVEKLSNGISFAYMGISGTDVTKYAHEELGVPSGAYVTQLEMDSPGMLAGIQVGDVLTTMNGNVIQSFGDYCTQLMRLNSGQTVELVIMRQSQNEYREMTFTIELGELNG